MIGKIERQGRRDGERYSRRTHRVRCGRRRTIDQLKINREEISVSGSFKHCTDEKVIAGFARSAQHRPDPTAVVHSTTINATAASYRPTPARRLTSHSFHRRSLFFFLPLLLPAHFGVPRANCNVFLAPSQARCRLCQTSKSLFRRRNPTVFAQCLFTRQMKWTCPISAQRTVRPHTPQQRSARSLPYYNGETHYAKKISSLFQTKQKHIYYMYL